LRFVLAFSPAIVYNIAKDIVSDRFWHHVACMKEAVGVFFVLDFPPVPPPP
jgi:hypothetical protein